MTGCCGMRSPGNVYMQKYKKYHIFCNYIVDWNTHLLFMSTLLRSIKFLVLDDYQLFPASKCCSSFPSSIQFCIQINIRTLHHFDGKRRKSEILLHLSWGAKPLAEQIMCWKRFFDGILSAATYLKYHLSHLYKGPSIPIFSPAAANSVFELRLSLYIAAYYIKRSSSMSNERIVPLCKLYKCEVVSHPIKA